MVYILVFLIILCINDICNNVVCRMDDDLIGLGIRVFWYRYINSVRHEIDFGWLHFRVVVFKDLQVSEILILSVYDCLDKIGSNCGCMIQGLQKVLRGPKNPAIPHGSSCTIVEVIKLCLQHFLIQWPYHFIWWSWNCGGIVCSHQLAHHFSIEFWLPKKWNNVFKSLQA